MVIADGKVDVPALQLAYGRHRKHTGLAHIADERICTALKLGVIIIKIDPRIEWHAGDQVTGSVNSQVILLMTDDVVRPDVLHVSFVSLLIAQLD